MVDGDGHFSDVRALFHWVSLPVHHHKIERMMPPSIRSEEPVIYEAAGESKNAAAAPNSSVVPRRFIGILPSDVLRASSMLIPCLFAAAPSGSLARSVSQRPVTTLFTP